MDGIAIETKGDTMVMVWKEPATVERFAHQMELCDKILQSHPDFRCLSIILGSSTPPDGKLRGIMQARFKGFGPRMKLMCAVPVGNSIWLSVVRTLVKSIMFVSGQSKVQAVCSTVAEGIAKVREVASQDTPTEAELFAMVKALHAQLGIAL